MDLFTFLGATYLWGESSSDRLTDLQHACEHSNYSNVNIKVDSDEKNFDSRKYILKPIVAIRFCLNLESVCLAIYLLGEQVMPIFQQGRLFISLGHIFSL